MFCVSKGGGGREGGGGGDLLGQCSVWSLEGNVLSVSLCVY